VPRRTLVSNKILEDEGVLGDVNVADFHLYFLPLEDDVLSLELGDAFVELYLVSEGGIALLASIPAYLPP
jgi:vacuolar protein sorting-associated protein 33A